MGRAKADMMEREEHERDCPNCYKAVWVNWGESPNVECEECGYTDTVVQCENCLNLISKDTEAIVCDDCIEMAMKD